MNTPEPARKIYALQNELLDLAESDAGVSLAALNHIEWQARTCLRTDPGDARMVLGMLAALKNDPEKAVREHQASLRYGLTYLRAYNYAGTLIGLYRPKDALEQFMTALTYASTEKTPNVLQQAMSAAKAVGQLHRAASLLAQYRQEGLEMPEGMAAFGEQLDALLPVADALNLTDEAMEATQIAAWAALQEWNGPRNLPILIEDAVIHDDRPSILRTYWVPASEEEGHALNRRMKAIWAERDDASPIEDFCPIIIGRGDA